MLLKQPEDSNLNLPVWDPRVSMKAVFYLYMFKMWLCLRFVLLYTNREGSPNRGNLLRSEKFIGVLNLAQQMEYRYICFLIFHVSSFLCPHVTWNLIGSPI